MAQQVVGLFDGMDDARSAVRDLQQLGITNADISFVASNARGEYDATGNRIAPAGDADATGAGAGAGALGGAAIGGILGVLVGLGALAIPGIGPVLAAGPLAAAIGTTGAAVGAGAVGAAAGAAAGGLLGALVGAGIPEEDANVYAEGVRRGGTVVVARVADSNVDAVLDVMDRNHAVDIDQRRQEFQAGGWTRYDENAGEYEVAGAGGTRAERQVGGTTLGQARTRGARSYAAADTRRTS